MKITIAINGEGRGHFSRARAIAEIVGKSHDITFRAPGHLADELSELFPDNDIRRIPYFSFAQRGFRIDYRKTISSNARLFLEAPAIHRKLADELLSEGCGMVLSDFEPFTSRAARIAGIPVLQLNHPGIVSRTADLSPAGLAAKIVAIYMMAGAKKTIICSFFDGDVGPIIRRSLRDRKVARGDYFVVYQKSLYREMLAPVLGRIGEGMFRVFPDSRECYEDALAGCAGLVAPAGHQSISEALALGKPAFVIPVKGQYEQELNARRLRESGFGDYAYIDGLESGLPRFISDITRFETAIAKWKDADDGKAKGRWLCRDDTLRAVEIVERFIASCEWDRGRRMDALSAPLLASLVP